MTDPVKQFLREFYSPMQHWRTMKFIEHIKAANAAVKAFFNSWRNHG